MTGPTETAGKRIVVTEFVTLDGYMVGADEDMSWVAAGFDQQMQDDIATDMDSSYDTFVFGRVTYDIFAAYWPHALPYAYTWELEHVVDADAERMGFHELTSIRQVPELLERLS